MENVKVFLENVWHIKIINSVIILLLSIVIYRGVIYFFNKSEEKNKSKIFKSNKGKTYIKLIRNLTRYVFIIITILILLQANGINVSSVLAGVGILGAVFGLAIQDWLKDIIRGSSIISDNYFSVGDIIKYKNIEGKVLLIGLKTTKIQDLKTNNIISIANRNIEEVEIVSKYIYIKIPMPYEVSIERAEKTIEEIIEIIKNNNNVNDCRYLGVNELADSSIQYLLEINCTQQYKFQVKRDALRVILQVLEDKNIEVPYRKITIYNND